MLYIYSRNIPGQTGCLAANTWYLVLIVSSELFVPPLPLLRIPNTYKKSARYATLALRMGRVHRHRQRSTPQHDPHPGTSSGETCVDTTGNAHPNMLDECSMWGLSRPKKQKNKIKKPNYLTKKTKKPRNIS